MDMNIDLFKDEFEECQKGLADINARFPWEDQKAYLGWLVQTYEYAFNSTRILALAGGYTPSEMTLFSNRFISHAAEEKGHEKLLEKDAKNLGYDIRGQEVYPEAKAFHQSLYYWLGYSTPLGIFGWVTALEGFAVRNVPQIHKICEAKYGRKASSFLRVHADEDEGHLESAFKTIEKMSAANMLIVSEAMKQYAYLYGQILETIDQNVSTSKLKLGA